MTRTIEQIATTWAARAEAASTLPAAQAVHHVADWGQYLAQAFRDAAGSPTRAALAGLHGHVTGAADALLALASRLPETGTVEVDTGPIPRLKRTRY